MPSPKARLASGVVIRKPGILRHGDAPQRGRAFPASHPSYEGAWPKSTCHPVFLLAPDHRVRHSRPDPDETRIIDAPAAYLILRQRADDLPVSLDLGDVAAAYDGFIEHIRKYQPMTSPSPNPAPPWPAHSEAVYDDAGPPGGFLAGSSAANPRSLNALISSRTVCSVAANIAAISGTDRPFASTRAPSRPAASAPHPASSARSSPAAAPRPDPAFEGRSPAFSPRHTTSSDSLKRPSRIAKTNTRLPPQISLMRH
jgi:hypothetical protein